MSTAKAILLQLMSTGFLAVFAAMMAAWVWAYRERRAGRPIIDGEGPRPARWGAVSIVLVIVAWYASGKTVVNCYDLITHRPPNAKRSLTAEMALGSLVNGVTLLVVPLVLRISSGARFADLGMSLQGFGRHVRAGALAFLLVAFPINAINIVCAKVWVPEPHPLEDMVRKSPTGQVAGVAFVSAVLFAPAAEELLFRVVLQGWLYQAILALGPFSKPDSGKGSSPSDSAWYLESESPALTEPADAPSPSAKLMPGPPDALAGRSSAGATAVIVTSALFAAAHAAQWPAPIAIFFLSLALGTVYLRTGSFWSSFVLHALFNGLSTSFLFYALLYQDPALKRAAPPPAAQAISLSVSVRPGATNKLIQRSASMITCERIRPPRNETSPAGMNR